MATVDPHPPEPTVSDLQEPSLVLTPSRWDFIWTQLKRDGVDSGMNMQFSGTGPSKRLIRDLLDSGALGHVNSVVNAKLSAVAKPGNKAGINATEPDGPRITATACISAISLSLPELEHAVNSRLDASPREQFPPELLNLKPLWFQIKRYHSLHLQELHGGLAEADWADPIVAASTKKEARPGYHSLNASEYVDTTPVLEKKLKIVAEMLQKGKNVVVYSGAGLSTAAGISDYGTKAEGSIAPHRASKNSTTTTSSSNTTTVRARAKAYTSVLKPNPFQAQPTPSHHVLACMHKKKMIQHWVNQNHDRLPQKAGFPPTAINEIHGAWGDAKNPVVKMSGSLRADLNDWLEEWEEKVDVCLAVGTSLCGMNADRIAVAAGRRGGLVIIGLSPTRLDGDCAVRIWGLLDDVFLQLAGAGFLDLGCIPNVAVENAGKSWQRQHPGLNYSCPMRNGYAEETPEQIDRRSGQRKLAINAKAKPCSAPTGSLGGKK